MSRTIAMYSSRQAAKLVNLPEARVKAYAPNGVGFQELAVLRTAARLISEGLSASKVERALTALRKQLGPDRALSSLQLKVESGALVASDGDHAWEPTSGQQRFAFGKQSLAPVRERKALFPEPPAPDAVPTPLRDTIGAIFDGPSDMTAADYWFDIAMSLEDNDPSGAYDAYLRALACDPEHVEATINIGRMCSDGGDLKRACAYFRNAVRIDATHPVAHFNLAVSLHDLGDFEGAANAYRAAIAQDASFADAHFNLAALLEQRGERDEALRHLAAYEEARRRE